jgi:DNA-binding NarL/FixJ family response regulator
MNVNVPIKIAIADDHDIFKEGIEMILNFIPDMNLMIKACNGRDLLDQIENNQPDVVLLDLRMPILDGFSTLKELKRLYHMIKVIILSMDGDSSQVQQALRMGADAHLLKSSDPTVIYKAIRESCTPWCTFNQT